MVKVREVEEDRETPQPQDAPRLSSEGIQAMQGQPTEALSPADGSDQRGESARHAAEETLVDHQVGEQDIIGRRRYASEAAARSTVGNGAMDLDALSKDEALGFQGDNYPTYDLSSRSEVASVKTHWNSDGELDGRAVKAYQRDFAHMLGWGRTPGAVEQDGENIVAARDAGLPVPRELEDADPKEAAGYLRDNSRLRIPDDHVGPVRAEMEQDIRTLPSNYYLEGDPSQEQVDGVLERVQGIGMSSRELQEITGEAR